MEVIAIKISRVTDLKLLKVHYKWEVFLNNGKSYVVRLLSDIKHEFNPFYKSK